MSDKWNQERVDYLVQCFKDGLSGGQAAGKMTTHFNEKFTRCSVVAKWNRMGLMRGQETKRQRSSVARRVRVAKRARPEPTVRQSALAEVLSRAPREPAPKEENPADFPDRKTLQQLTDAMCRWPIGDPQHDDFGFCGKNKVTGLPYCEHHARRAYQPVQVKPRAPKPVVVLTFNDLEKV